MEKKLDWHYMETELDVLKLSKFEKETRQLCRMVFSMENVELTSAEHKRIAYYISSGTYGTMQNRIMKKLRKVQPGEACITKATRRRYLLKRLFPDMDYYQQYAPFVYRHNYLIPGFIVYRTLRGIICNGKKIVCEIRIMNRIEK